MKVLMVNNQLSVLGGSETYMFSVGDELSARGHVVEYFGRVDPSHKYGNRFELYAISKNDPINIIRNRENCRTFGKLLDQFQPDIIHLNLVYFALTPSIVHEAKRRNIPVIQTVHDPKIVCPCHRFYIEHTGKPCIECVKKLDFKNCVRNKCIKGSYIKSVMAYVEAEYHKRMGTYQEIDKFVFPSRFMMEQHIGKSIDASKAVVMHNFSRIERRHSISKASEKYVLYFGRIGREKGIETLVEACKLLPEIKFIIAGSGDMENAFSSLNNCDLVGFKTGRELEDLIAGAVVSVIPSIWYENCPMSVLESIALGTPVIGSDIGGIPELIDRDNTGLVFRSGDYKQLSECIERLYFDDKKAKQMALNCISNSKLNTVHDYVDELLVHYEEVRRS